MSSQTKIEWADATWNPITGCSKVSEGCRNCYALKFAERWRGTPGHYFEHGFDITLRPDKLDQPLKWKRPRRIFVNSMSDLFHPGVPDQFIVDVISIMAEAQQHTFQLLTKRPDRMRELLSDPYMANNVWLGTSTGVDDRKPIWPLPNVWIGVSVENQQAADERIPLLLQTPAAIRFLSCEPLLGPVNLREYYGDDEPYGEFINAIDWVIVGGESGPGARPMHPKWVRGIRDQCQAAAIPFFFKQWGEWQQVQRTLADDHISRHKHKYSFDSDTVVVKVGKRKAGRLLDGREWNEYPSMED